MAIQWIGEACHRYQDPASGAWVIQLTSSSCTSINIYGEQPYCSPDGRRVAVLRAPDIHLSPHAMFLVADLQRLGLALVARDVYPLNRPCNNAYSEYVYYWNPANQLIRVSLLSLESQVILVDDEPGVIRGGGSVAPDQRTMMFGMYLPGPRPVVMRYDLETGRREVFYEHPEIVNPHPQYEPVTGRYVMIMRNHGALLARDGTVEKLVGDFGPTLFLVAADTGREVPLPAGQPHTARIGHQCFIPGADAALFTTFWNMETWECDPRHPETNVMIARPGEELPTPFRCPEHRGNHISASRCGTYFVMDSYEGAIYDEQRVIKPMALVVGNLQTGRYRILVSSTGASGGGNGATHPHPYITADNRYVIFNSDQYGVPQVLAAEIPAGFLESLN
ncbi:hypothetical protein HQ590_02490 [bacterium]|nr:hypothetical protein [bacterium]